MQVDAPQQPTNPLRHYDQSRIAPAGSRNSDDETSSVDEVYDQILLRIIQGEFVGGHLLTSTRLARELGVSRTPIVAALDRLAADGILQKQKNRRAFVRPGAENWLVQVHQLREMLEPPAAALAAEAMTDDAVAGLEQLAKAAYPKSSDEWLAAARDFDFALHLSIADHCGSLPLCNAIYKCWSFKQLSYSVNSNTPEILEVGHREHISILNALKRKDAATASAAMLFHLRSAAYLTLDHRIV